MTEINWGILGGVDSGNAFQQGFANGRNMRREIETDNALARYAQNPDDPTAANALARFNPQMAMKIRAEQQKRQQDAEQRRLTAAALNGDPQAKHQLAGIDPELFMRMDDHTRKNTTDRVKAIGQAALWADNPQKWDQAIDQLSQTYPELSQYRGQFSEQARASVIAQAGEMNTFLERNDPKYMAVPSGGGLVNVRDPQALQTFNAQSEAASAAQVQSGPAVGATVNGFTFKGGNPNDRANWQKGGPTPQASGNFPSSQ